MKTRTPIITLCFLAIGLMLRTVEVAAQSTPANAQNGEQAEALQMTVDYGQGKTKKRHSRDGLMEPVGLPLNQTAAITLKFPGQKAGETVTIGAPDGGEIIPAAGNLLLSANGSIVFNFRADGTAGLYRLVVELPGESHLLSFYAFALPASH